MSIQITDRVEWKYKGKTHTGIVINTRIKKARGANRELAFWVSGNESALDREVCEVTQDDQERVWVIPTSQVTKVGTASEQESYTAYQVKQDIADSKAQRRRNQRLHNESLAELNDVHALQLGQDIEVKYRDGWKKASYQGKVRGSGNVRFYDGYKNRTCSPKFVRIPS